MTRILATDPGLNVTGYSVADCDRLRRVLVAFGHHDARSLVRGDAAKIESQVSRFRELLDEFKPEVVAVEQYRYMGTKTNTKNALTMSKLIGKLEEAAASRGASVIGGIDKNVANRAAGLVGKADGARVKRSVRAILGLGPKVRTNAHVDDSLLVLIAASQRLDVKGIAR